MNFRPLVVASLALFITGCGYFLAGEWRDDPKNWKRAFGGTAPAGLIMHHSYYSRAPHFTTEWCYYFELEDSKIARDAIGVYGLLKPSNKKPSDLPLDAGRPNWFLPIPPLAADVWEYPGATEFFAVIDRVHGRIYVHDQQF